MADRDDIPPVRLKLRLVFGDRLTLGPGKADLLERIGALGSISAAGRAMGMSYRRAWSLVEEMNAAFGHAIVQSTRGGPQGGGAHLTPEGRQVLTLYRELEDRTAEAGADQIAALRGMLGDMPQGK